MASGVYRSVGPGPLRDGPNFKQSGDKPVGTGSGAVTAIATSPTDANTIWIATTNGGIWKTTDGGSNWIALTDHQASLSITSITLDPTDTTNNTLIAGVGIVDNGSVGSSDGNSFRGGQRTGLLRSTDGGTTWSPVGGTALAGLSVVNTVARGATILAATFEPQNSTSTGTNFGIYRSTDGGATFSQLDNGNGLVSGAATSLVGSVGSGSRLYAAITSPSAKGSSGVFVSNDTGATWTQIFGAGQSAGLITAGGNQTVLRVASGANGQVAVLVISVTGSTQSTVGLFYTSNNGTTWAQFALPTLDMGSQAVVNTAIAIDPTNSGVVYVSGVNDGNNLAPVFRVTSSGATSLTGAGNTGDGSAPSTDSRAITFDHNGNLVFGSDGGIWSRSSPTTSTGIWKGLNSAGTSGSAGFLANELVNGISFDGNSKRVAVAMQDNAVALQTSASSTVFTALASGDGVNATFNDITGGTTSVLYSSDQTLGTLNRNAIAPDGTVTRATVAIANLGGNFVPAFATQFVLNKIDPTRIAIGARNLFVTQDAVGGNLAATSISLTVSDIGGSGSGGGTATGITEVAYGTQDNTNALLGGGSTGLWFSGTAAVGSATQLTAYTGAAAAAVTFDLRSSSRFFVADGLKLFSTTNQGATFQDITGTMPTNFQRPVALAFVANNGVSELLVGGLASNATSGALGSSPIAIADSDAAGALTNFRGFGAGLANTYASSLAYDVKADTLAVGLYGRGGWVMNDFTSNFATASSLQFGLADNDSTPDAAKLSGGRALFKSGTGKLTLTGAASYTGGTTISNGLLQLGVITPAVVTASIMGVVAFQGVSSALALAQDMGFANMLSGLTIGAGGARTNFIDILGKVVSVTGATGSGSSTSGTVNLSDGATLNVSGLSSTNWFGNAASDGAGGTNIFLSDTACYARGTRIRTDAGDVAVEALAVGQLALTASGRLAPIMWIGHRRVATAQHPRPHDVLPVRVLADAFGAGLPQRDLVLSPDHAVFFDGNLIPIRYLLNGASIRQEKVAEVQYFHIELDRHDVLLAEAMPAESYLDTGNRTSFANHAGAVRMHADFARAVWQGQSCAPLVLDGPVLAAVRQAVNRRLPALGFDVSEALAVRFYAEDGGELVAQCFGDWFCLALPDGTRFVRLLSPAAAPAELDACSDDRRSLGAALAGLRMDGVAVGLDDARLGAGWHDVEPDLRWTTGDGVLDVTGVAIVELRFARATLARASAAAGRRLLVA